MTQKLKILGPYTPEHEGPFCTRDGKHVRILCFDMRNEYTIVAIIRDENGKETVGTFLSDGRFCKEGPAQDLDLMNAEEVPQPREFWIVANTVCHSLANAEDLVNLWAFPKPSIIHVREVMPGEGE